ncbi:unnamed protein product [Choristocarpus tenellus]
MSEGINQYTVYHQPQQPPNQRQELRLRAKRIMLWWFYRPMNGNHLLIWQLVCGLFFAWQCLVNRASCQFVGEETAQPISSHTPSATRIEAKAVHPNGPPLRTLGTTGCPAQELGFLWMTGADADNGPCGKQELQAYRNRTDVHFLGLGVQKGGTSTLFQRLFSHPRVIMATPKETMYFLHADVGKEEPSEAKKDYLTTFWGTTQEMDVGIRRGEVTPEYQAWPVTPPLVLRVLGSPLRFISILREPVARAYSFYQMHKRLRKKSKLIRKKKKIRETFELTIEKEFMLLQECISGARGKISQTQGMELNRTVNVGKGFGEKEWRGEGSVMGLTDVLESQPGAQWGEEDMSWYRDCYLPR